MPSPIYLHQSAAPLRRLFSYLVAFKKDYRLAVLFSCLNKLFDIFPEILIGGAVDIVVNRQNSWISKWIGLSEIEQQLLALGLLTFIIWAFESLFQYLYNIKWRNLAQSVEHKLRMDCYSHIQSSTLTQISKSQIGKLIAIINDDINQLERFLEDGVNQILQIIASTCFIAVVFFICSPLITLFAIIPVPFILLGAFYFQHKLEPRFMDVREKSSNISSALSHNLQGLSTIKSFTAEDYEIDKINALSEAYQQANHKTIKISSMVTPVIRIVILCGFLSTLLIGGFQTMHGQMNVGVFSVLVFLSQRLLWPFSNLAEVTVNFQRAMASTRRALDLLSWPKEVFIDTTNKPIKENQAITFENVNFRYSNQSHLFENFNLKIPANKTTAFVGESGSGKSSIIRLLCRFYPINGGKILYGNENIDTFNLKKWRENISLVSQDVFLFPGTIYENVAYANQNATKESVIAALKLAGADSFVNNLDKGLESKVFESGNNLSGGQKQRLIIARALLKNAPILIFDEATSAVDNETEKVIQEAMKHISKGRTTLLIAHRLSTVRHADNIIVLDNGKIIEQGRHETLLAKKGRYYNLWSIQTGEIAP